MRWSGDTLQTKKAPTEPRDTVVTIRGQPEEQIKAKHPENERPGGSQESHACEGVQCIPRRRGQMFQNEGSAQLCFCHRQPKKMRRARLTLAQEVVYVLFI